MSDRHDLRRQTREIHEALGRFDREQLLDILTHIFRVYVVEGANLAAPPPAALSDELSGLSFAQLIERLQLRLDLPELQAFEVQGGRVSVRVDGRLIPLEAAASRSDPPVPPPALARPQPPASSTPAGSAAAEARPAASPSAAPPAGLQSAASAVRAEARPSAPPRPASSAPVSASSRPSAMPTNPPAAPANPPPARSENKPAEESGQSGRFGLLEID